MKLVLLAVLAACFAHHAEARKCYACVPDKAISGVSIAASLTNILNQYPKCSDFEKEDKPDARFEMTCPRGFDATCMRAEDDDGNVMRTCFSGGKEECKTKKGLTTCYCKDNLCNSGGALFSSMVILISGLMALLCSH